MLHMQCVCVWLGGLRCVSHAVRVCVVERVTVCFAWVCVCVVVVGESLGVLGLCVCMSVTQHLTCHVFICATSNFLAVDEGREF